MALYKKTVGEPVETKQTEPKPSKKRKAVKEKQVTFSAVEYTTPPEITEQQRMFEQMFPGRSIGYCMQ